MEISTKPMQGDDRHAEVAYEAIAPVYDDFTAHHDYRLWIGKLVELGEAHGLRGDTVLDVACGTGKSFLPLLEGGWKVTACDISPSMAELARAKTGGRVPIEIADMRELPVYGSFDLVCCLDDAVNYLHSAAELEQTLRGLATNLAPDGVLIFDSNTVTTYRGFFGEHVEIEMNGRRLIWDGREGEEFEPGGIAEASFAVEPLEQGTGPSIPPVFHRQRHHPEAEVRAAIGGAGLELVGLYGHHHDGIPTQPMSEENHTKAIYVARLQRTT
ncbi:MAG TPA: class I SAM-dependent methyltransferase [Solirubrobacterales bacterium]|nr:class I SAM-dependent methyltransferase [Solirubrobacterales bacterium]